MTSQLAASFDAKTIDYTDPSNKERFFSSVESDKLNGYLNRESAPIGQPGATCKPNLFFGFFHDGTRNNFGKSISKNDHTHSNIARLYSCYPGRSVPNVIPREPLWEHEPEQFKNYFRVYVPGVGSVFELVNDTGKGKDAKLGAAMAFKGEPRIIWTLLQAVNNLHRFFKNDAPLVTADDARKLYGKVQLNKLALQAMTADWPAKEHNSARNEFETILRRLHNAIQYHMPGPDGGKPQSTDPGWVQEIYVSVFGFSRGAAAARAFANWLVALCKLDAKLLGKQGTTLGGFPVNFDFLGLFDTVASVGLANTLNTADGHWGWADAEVSLRVPNDFVDCLHLVSGHEVRRSFPLDSISVNNVFGSKRAEIVYPGVHSDVGGGYLPREQGKGKDPMGADMLSRLPLAHMYRAARLAGVPLKLELVTQQSVKEDFRIAPETIAVFNQYLGFARTTSGSLTDIMREQRNFYIQWRYMRRQFGPTPLEGNAEKGIKPVDSFLNAPQVDKNDLRSANEEFTKEIAGYERWRENYLDPNPMDGRAREWEPGRRKPEDIASQAPGFNNRWYDEWTEITRFWGREFLPDGMEILFDDYVHDSHAWFKLTGTESGDVEGELKSWLRQMKEYVENTHYDGEHKPHPLTQNQRKWALAYERTGQVPDEMKSDGREPAWSGAGYLRYRKIYAGADVALISHGRQVSQDQRLAANGPVNSDRAA